MNNSFKVGDVVYLRSGGISMVITKVFSDGVYVCAWHSTNGTPHSKQYPENVLVQKL